MRYVFTYVLVIVFSRFSFWLGTVLIGFPVAGCLAWTPGGLRGVVAGVLSGLGGVAAVTASSRWIFREMLGQNAFGLLGLVAATIPLIIPIRKDLALSRLLPEDVRNLRRLLHDSPATVQNNVADVAGAVGVKLKAVGALLGIFLAFLWLVYSNHANRHEKQPR